MCALAKKEAQNPLILRCHRLMDAFSRSDDERDFYIDRMEGFLVFVDLDKSQSELAGLEDEINDHHDRYVLIPKLSYYETKKLMEGFVNEKVYDIDTKEKLLDIIQSKEARDNFLEFIYDHHAEQEKWQQFYQERSRIRIIEWLRTNHFHFVFEEDLELPRNVIEKLKKQLFETRVDKDIAAARKALVLKAKTYYSNEALNPRPKRGRPPKQIIKQEFEPQVTTDIFTTVLPNVRPFLFTPELTQNFSLSAFSSKYETEQDILANKKLLSTTPEASLSQKLASLRSLSNRWVEKPEQKVTENWSDDEEEEDEEEVVPKKVKKESKPQPIRKLKTKAPLKTPPKKVVSEKKKPLVKLKKIKPKPIKKAAPAAKSSKPKVKRIMPQVKKKKR